MLTILVSTPCCLSLAGTDFVACIGQKLQDSIEILPGVDRAFVHLDWEGGHAIEHNGLAQLEKVQLSREQV